MELATYVCLSRTKTQQEVTQDNGVLQEMQLDRGLEFIETKEYCIAEYSIDIHPQVRFLLKYPRTVLHPLFLEVQYLNKLCFYAELPNRLSTKYHMV